MISHAYDLVVFALALGIPAYVVFRFERMWIAILLAAVSSWLVIYFGGRFLSAAHPSERAAYLDTVWLRTGWIAGLVYALLLVSLRFVFQRLRKHHAKA
jgi:small-conductance mechanosensitive channel